MAKKGKELIVKPGQELITQTDKEKLLVRLEELKRHGLNQAQQKQLAEREEALTYHFINLCKESNILGLTDESLAKLIKEGHSVQELERVVAAKARPWALTQLLVISAPVALISFWGISGAMLGVLKSAAFVAGPMLGVIASVAAMICVLGMGEAKSLPYFWRRSQVRKVLGKDYFPVQALKKELRIS